MKTLEIAFKKIKNGNIGAGAVIFFAIVLSFTVFAGLFLLQSLSRGAESMRERLGADIAVVPRGEEAHYQGILLSGEPVECALDRNLEQTLRETEGVERVTPVVYLASLNASCCSVPIQLIGYEPETDFVTSPWISEEFSTNYGEGSLVIGCNIAVDAGNQLTFFDRTYQVGARLHKTGTGMDKSVYVTFDTMEQMIQDARSKGIRFGADIVKDSRGEYNKITDSVVSAFLLRLKPGADPDLVGGTLLRNTSVGVVLSKSMIATTSEGFSLFSGVVWGIMVGVLILVVSVAAVLHVFRVQMRRKEWAVFLMMGASAGFIQRLVLAEVLLLSLVGAAIGIAAAALAVFPFQELIARQIDLPFYAPGWGNILLGIGISFVVTAVASMVPGVIAARAAARTDCYELMREGER